MKVYTIQPDAQLNKYTEWCLDKAIDGIRADLEDANPGTVLTIEVEEMSEEDYNKLPEYTGP